MLSALFPFCTRLAPNWIGRLNWAAPSTKNSRHDSSRSWSWSWTGSETKAGTVFAQRTFMNRSLAAVSQIVSLPPPPSPNMTKFMGLESGEEPEVGESISRDDGGSSCWGRLCWASDRDWDGGDLWPFPGWMISGQLYYLQKSKGLKKYCKKFDTF